MTTELVNWSEKSKTATLEETFDKQEGYFYFLTAAHLQQTYLLILGMAASRKDISRLHELLPEKFRIFRDELINLERLWLKINGKENTPRKRISDDVAKKILEMSTVTKWDEPSSWGGKQGDLKRHYIKRLKEKVTAKYINPDDRFNGASSRLGNTLSETLLNISGYVFTTNDVFTVVDSHIEFWLELSEPITINFIEMLKANKALQKYHCEHLKPHVLVILPFEPFESSIIDGMSGLKEESKKSQPYYVWWMDEKHYGIKNKELFMKALTSDMKTAGLDIKGEPLAIDNKICRSEQIQQVKNMK